MELLIERFQTAPERIAFIHEGREVSYGGVVASVERADKADSSRLIDFARSGEDWGAVVGDLEQGLYKIELRTKLFNATAPPPVHDVFQVET